MHTFITDQTQNMSSIAHLSQRPSHAARLSVHQLVHRHCLDAEVHLIVRNSAGGNSLVPIRGDPQLATAGTIALQLQSAAELQRLLVLSHHADRASVVRLRRIPAPDANRIDQAEELVAVSVHCLCS